MAVHLRPDVKAALLGHGLHPDASTSLGLMRGHLNDLYRFEIRRLKDRLRRGAFPLADYVPQVVVLRRRYRLLSLPLDRWTLPARGGPLR